MTGIAAIRHNLVCLLAHTGSSGFGGLAVQGAPEMSVARNLLVFSHLGPGAFALPDYISSCGLSEAWFGT